MTLSRTVFFGIVVPSYVEEVVSMLRALPFGLAAAPTLPWGTGSGGPALKTTVPTGTRTRCNRSLQFSNECFREWAIRSIHRKEDSGRAGLA